MTALIQQTEEWLEFRKNKVGASDAPVIMEVSPWKTPYELWQEKVGIKDIDSPTEYMKRGLQLESDARKCFEDKVGFSVSPKVVISKSKNWMVASLDGIDSENRNIVEIKCPGYGDHHYVDINKMVPDKYYPQIQHQMEVAGVDRAYYFSYIDNFNNILLEIERDQKYIDEMVEKEEQFYECIKNFIAPNLTNKDSVCKDDSEWKCVAQEWMKCKEWLKNGDITHYIEREKELRKTLIKMSEGKNCFGFGVNVQKFFRKGNIEYNKIEVLRHIDLEKYRKEPIEYWKVSGK